MTPAIQILIGFVLAVAISLLSLKVGALSRSGAWAAAALGTVIFGLGGLAWAVLLIGFFISSSALSRLLKKNKLNLEEKFSKGSRRDAGQVLANGGTAGICVIFHLVFPTSIFPWVAFAASLAAANADTWATELGVLSKKAPVLITSGKPVERGTSGGITLAGTLASLSGSLFIALLALIFTPLHRNGSFSSTGFFLLQVTLAGLAGSLVDSLLGATLQAIYNCPTCRKETERHPLHSCGSTTTRLRGLAWMDNDVVNALCTLAGASLAIFSQFFFW